MRVLSTHKGPLTQLPALVDARASLVMGLSKILQALDDEQVQAKIFELIFKPALDTSMASFGKGMGNKAGDLLAQFQTKYERKLEEVRVDFAKEIKAKHVEGIAQDRTDHDGGINPVMRSVAAPTLEDACTPTSSKIRRVRQKKCSANYAHSKEFLLHAWEKTIILPPLDGRVET